MGFAEQRGAGKTAYWRGRYKIRRGVYGTVCDEYGQTIRYSGKRDAKQAADRKEAEVAAEGHVDPRRGHITVGEWAARWFAGLEVGTSTRNNYRSLLEIHILPKWGEHTLKDLEQADELISAWEQQLIADGLEPSTAGQCRGRLSSMLTAAVDRGLIGRNPAGRRGGARTTTTSDVDDEWLDEADMVERDDDEEAWLTPLGVLLLAERAALLTGRDDDFVMIVTKAYLGLRWGELVGLETRYLGRRSVRVQWQLHEQDNGVFDRILPKQGRKRTASAPRFLLELLAGHVDRTEPQPCPCHGNTYVFAGGAAGHKAVGPVSIGEVARRAEVSTGTVSNVLNRPDRVKPATRERVEAAMAAAGFSRGERVAADRAPHWRRSGYSAWVFQPAATGWYPAKGPTPARPVPVNAGPWPGVPVRGRGAASRAAACWTPLESDLTPHGLRHSQKTWMREDRIDEILQHRRLGHRMGGVAARYSHVTPEMVGELLAHLDRRWHDSLQARVNLAPTSCVPVLDELLAPLRRQAIHAVPAQPGTVSATA